MVEMADDQSPAMAPGQALKNVQQDHRIHTPGYPHQDRFPGRQEIPFNNRPFDLARKFAHSGTLKGRHLTGKERQTEACRIDQVIHPGQASFRIVASPVA